MCHTSPVSPSGSAEMDIVSCNSTCVLWFLFVRIEGLLPTLFPIVRSLGKIPVGERRVLSDTAAAGQRSSDDRLMIYMESLMYLMPSTSSSHRMMQNDAE